jgi:hypothetical protein
MIKTRHKKTDRQKQEVLLDELWSEYIRRLAMKLVGGCQKCKTLKGSYKELDAAHFHVRGNHTTRWDIRNGVGLCWACHMHLDHHEEAKIEFEKRILGEEEYESLYILANLTTKQAPVDLKLKEIELRELLKEV